MCTLTIAPDGGGVVLASNRDESRERASATLPQCRSIGGNKLLMPIDPQGGGSWIAASDNGRVACLLNGAGSPHESRPPYAKSRGLILKDSFEWQEAKAFAEEVPLCAIGTEKLDVEPFTLVMCSAGEVPFVTVLRWYGNERAVDEFPLQEPLIFNAVKLYAPKVIEESEVRFKDFLQNLDRAPSLEDLRRFNEKEDYRSKIRKAGEIPVEGLDTLSCTLVSLQKKKAHLEFIDHKEELRGMAEHR